MNENPPPSTALVLLTGPDMRNVISFHKPKVADPLCRFCGKPSNKMVMFGTPHYCICHACVAQCTQRLLDEK